MGAVLLDRGAPAREVDASELRELRTLLRSDWQRRNAALEEESVPVASRQYFREVLGDPPVANQTTVAAAAETNLWDVASLTALGASQVRAGQAFKVSAFGVTTTAVTGAQTLIVTPRFGSSATPASNTSLGASRTAAIQAAVNTNVPWYLDMLVHFRTTGSSGTATCGGRFDSFTAIGTAATTNASTITFGTSGTTATTVNTTTAAGLIVSVTPSLATQTFTCLGVIMEALN